MTYPDELVGRAYAYAKMMHEGQLRKYTDQPYILHPVAVATMIGCIDGTPAMMAAALLHDVVEDTLATSQDVHELFGFEIGSLVDWLTVPSDLSGNRAERTRWYRDRIAFAPASAQTIKVADLLDNTSSIVEHDPKFARVYLVEKSALLRVLTKANPELLKVARSQLTRGERKLSKHFPIQSPMTA